MSARRERCSNGRRSAAQPYAGLNQQTMGHSIAASAKSAEPKLASLHDLRSTRSAAARTPPVPVPRGRPRVTRSTSATNHVGSATPPVSPEYRRRRRDHPQQVAWQIGSRKRSPYRLRSNRRKIKVQHGSSTVTAKPCNTGPWRRCRRLSGGSADRPPGSTSQDLRQ
jgi:hypothetical protein